MLTPRGKRGKIKLTKWLIAVRKRVTGYKQVRYSLHVSANARLIIELDATEKTIMICEEVEVEGVTDYHGAKDNWYIP